jgi:GrpB-like predicted nucleotidyltransferase (UPF0157 family)
LPGARVEHVGSTAVPGSLTKGDLDICVIVEGGQFERASRVPAGSPDERFFAGRRDRLRADPELRARYDELKRRHQDGGMDAYAPPRNG